MRKFLIIFLLSFTFAQDDLLSFLEDEQFVPLPTQGTFKATRIVNAQSVELPRSKTLEFIITHRFGTMSNGFYDLYGLDEASARFDLSYGFNEKISLGAGRSSHKKKYDFFSKIKLYSQKSTPSLSFASIVLFSKVEIATIAKNENFNNRLIYDFQLLLARKVNQNLSIQIIPTLIHKNLIQRFEAKNNLFSIGLGSRIKLTKRVSLNGDTFFPLGGRGRYVGFTQSWGLGCDIDTGGHVFQLIITNAQGTYESAYIEEANGTLKGGNVFFGFNITRSFNFN